MPARALPAGLTAVALLSARQLLSADHTPRDRAVPAAVIHEVSDASERVGRRDLAPALDLLSGQVGDDQGE